jgi:hypothetical protein
VERAFLDVLPALFLLSAGYDFGQREHLMAVAALPYLFAAERRAAGEVPRGRIAVGLLAGVAFALKPHFLGVPALVELYVLLRRRPDGAFLPGLGMAFRRSLRDPVPWLMVGLWAVYLVTLPLAFPDYLGTVAPLVGDFYLDLGGLTVAQVLMTPRLGAALCLLLPLLVVTFRRLPLRAPGGALPAVLALAAVTVLASAIAQHKGWSCHVLPIELFACGLGGVLAARWIDRRRISLAAPAPYTVAAVLGGLFALYAVSNGEAPWKPPYTVAAVLGGLFALYAVSNGEAPWKPPYTVAAVLGGLFALYAVSNGEAPWKELSYPDGQVAGLAALLEHEAAGERVLVLSPGIYPVYPALNYAGVQSTLRTVNMWLLQGAYNACLANGRRYREVWEMGRAEFFVYRTVAEDFARSPPAAVLVDVDSGIPRCGGQFDFIAYFKRHPLFAEVWSHYQLSSEWGRYRLYALKD